MHSAEQVRMEICVHLQVLYELDCMPGTELDY